jgi:predicted RNA binding protein YcfA (HicA-like mRNA interferase family)
LNGQLKRHGANHDLYQVPGVNRPVSIPRHKGDLPTGTARAILRQLGLTEEEARKLL